MQINTKYNIGDHKGQQKNFDKHCKLFNVPTIQKYFGHVLGHQKGRVTDMSRTQTIMIIILFILLINIKVLREIFQKAWQL